MHSRTSRLVAFSLISIFGLSACGAKVLDGYSSGTTGATTTAGGDVSNTSGTTSDTTTADGVPGENGNLKQRLLDEKGVLGAGPRASVSIYTEQAKAGDSDAQTRLAVCHYVGQGTAENQNEAKKWFASAAEANDKKAQYCLAYMFEHGEGGPEDKREAYRWYQCAAEGQGGYSSRAEKEVTRLSHDFDPAERSKVRKEVLDWFNASNLRKTKAEKTRRAY